MHNDRFVNSKELKILFSVLKMETKWTIENCLGFGPVTTIEERRTEGANAMQVRNKTKIAGKCKRNKASIEMVDDFRFVPITWLKITFVYQNLQTNGWEPFSLSVPFSFFTLYPFLIQSLSLSLVSVTASLICLFIHTRLLHWFTRASHTHILLGETSWDPSITIDSHSW